MSNYFRTVNGHVNGRSRVNGRHSAPPLTLGYTPGPVVKAISSPTARLIGAAGGAYHGYRRNRSVTWAIVWSMLGSLSPVVTGAVAVAQGFGKRKGAK